MKFEGVTLRRGGVVLVDEVSFAFSAQQKVGLTGANGTGKSSLLAMMLGQIEADEGRIVVPSDWVIAHVKQETPASDLSAMHYVLEGDVEVSQLLAEIAAAEASADGARLATLHTRFEEIDGYSAESRAGALLSGLGFKANEVGQGVTTFSGGWRMRLNLAQALMCRSDCLLLDEPTNHLDLNAVIWLQTWLERYAGMLMLISHDREFLDAVIKTIAHIEQGKLKLYSGNYSAFEQQRAAQLAQQQAAFTKQQLEIKHIQSFITRFKAQATKAKQAQSRVKMLERMQQIAPAHVDSPFHFQFVAGEQVPGSLLALESVSFAYGEATVLDAITLGILPGDRIGLIGPNGAGKSTLIKLLAGGLLPDSGSRTTAKKLRIGYFAQHQLDQLESEETPYWHIDQLALGLTEQQINSHLGGFGFIGARVREPIRHFSGGEKARLVLSLLVAQKPNLLLLDEPTNHLDIEMRHALALALQEFEGALVTVSHDRFLLRSVTDTLWLVANGAVEPYDGDLDDYRALTESGAGFGTDDDTSKVVAPGSKKHLRRERALERARLKPLHDQLRKLERDLDRLTVQATEWDNKLADPDLYEPENKAKLTALLRQKGDADRRLAAVESEWMAASEVLEAS